MFEQKCLQYEELGPKRVRELEAEMNEWSQRGVKAVHSIQDITADYFRDTSRALTGLTHTALYTQILCKGFNKSTTCLKSDKYMIDSLVNSNAVSSVCDSSSLC